MKIAFIGSVVPSSHEPRLKRFSQALKMFQRNMLRALAEEGVVCERTFSVRPVLHHPRQPDLVYAPERTTTDDGVPLLLLPFINVPAIKQLTLASALFPALVGWGIRHRRTRRAIVMHNLFPAPAIVCWLAARLTRTPIFAVVADLHVPGSGSRARTLLNRIDFSLQLAAFRRLTGAVVLTRQMRDDFAPHVPFVEVDGAVSEEARVAPARELREYGPFIFMYAGALSRTKGTLMLLDAFAQLQDQPCELWISGDGDARSDVERAAARDPRIRYHGFLPYDAVLELFQRATVLVNPHVSDVASSRYQFPSKLLEYLSSSRPVISSVTPGVDAYAGRMLLVEEHGAIAFADAMRRAMTMPVDELAAIGRRGREFVLREKTWGRQGRRIAEFLDAHVPRRR